MTVGELQDAKHLLKCKDAPYTIQDKMDLYDKLTCQKIDFIKY